ncbi:MAG TPA: hypothetical protein VMF08_00685 [Candidatus Sulfotelmatobacter sp.]|nr:hypothetical protein [Candidatus Sulfotelmatobacter sp.]
MEQERKIEKWLRSYAKKRRGQAGESFKLDPATRRILQAEVSHSAAPAEEEDDSLSLWQVLRQQWLFLLGFAACIFVIAAFFFQTLNTAKTRVELATTTANLRQIGAATHMAAVDNGGTLPATLDALTNGYLSAREISQIKSGKAITYVAGGQKLSDLPNDALVAYSKEENNRRGVVLADGSVHYVSEMNFASLTNSNSAGPELASGEQAMTPPAAAMKSQTGSFGGKPGIGGNSPAAAIPNQKMSPMAQTRTGFGGGGGGFGQSFAAARQQPFANFAENSFKNTIAPPSQSSPVLMNFQVSQNGNVIRVVDQDGSVYSGVLQPGGQGQKPAAVATDNEVAQNYRMVQNNNAAAPDSTIQSPDLEGRTVVPPGQAAQGSPGYAFRVKGMNKTLKQSVMFTGTLLEDLSMAKDVQNSFGWTANAAVGAAYAQQAMKSEQTNSSASAQLPWSSLRITGTAIINQTNRIEVNAMPVAPMTKAGNIK